MPFRALLGSSPAAWLFQNFIAPPTAAGALGPLSALATPACPHEPETIVDFPGAPEMTVVHVGQFVRGSHFIEDESPMHHVVIARPFAVGRFPVTFEEWAAAQAAGTELASPADRGWGRGRRPVINVSWHDARAYCAWLSRTSGQSYRLLSEAEWEYCCRAGSMTDYAFGDCIETHHAHFSSRMFDNPRSTSEVGRYPANAWGLHDMHGNVWEWVEDRWHDNYRGAPRDGSVWEGGHPVLRVLRGGAWTDEQEFVRSGVRTRAAADRRDRHIGFRVARDL